MPDEKWGEVIQAIVVRRGGSAVDASTIIARARERLAGYKLPRSVEFIDVFPRNPTGKLQKRELREKYWRGHERRVNW